jgi:hypothetical protein
LKALFRQPFDDLSACIERIAGGRRPFVALAALPLAMAVTWLVYVPIHELLHVLGCVASGGSVSELEIQPIYGGALLAEAFPFVVTGGSYAGRLSGFDTRGSDLVYLATDVTPFLLTVVLGVPVLRLCARRRRQILFGSAVVVGLAPFYSIPGDYYEMGSILTTRVVTWLTGGGGAPAYAEVRSDDIFALVGDLLERPAELGLASGGETAIAAGLIGLSLAVAVLLAFLTYALGGVTFRVLTGLRPRGPAG